MGASPGLSAAARPPAASPPPAAAASRRGSPRTWAPGALAAPPAPAPEDTAHIRQAHSPAHNLCPTLGTHHTWGAEAGRPGPDSSKSSSCRKFRTLCSLASESSIPSSAGPSDALSFPSSSRLSAVRELASSCKGHSIRGCWGRRTLAGTLGQGWDRMVGRQGRLGRPVLEGRASQATQTLHIIAWGHCWQRGSTHPRLF